MLLGINSLDEFPVFPFCASTLANYFTLMLHHWGVG
jgi:hypothetical protein